MAWLRAGLTLSVALAVGCGSATPATPTPTAQAPSLTPTAPATTATPSPSPPAQIPRVAFGDFAFTVELAVTPQQRELGLMGRDGLERDRGMLFIYPSDGLPGFWMRGMAFPLDIIWIDAQGVVAGVAASVPPAPVSDPPLYYPPRAIRYVLEVNAGMAQELGIGPGSRAAISGVPTANGS